MSLSQFDVLFAKKLIVNDLSADNATLSDSNFNSAGFQGSLVVDGTLTVTEDLDVGYIIQSSSSQTNSLGPTTISELNIQSFTVDESLTFNNLNVNGTTSLNTVTQSGKALIDDLTVGDLEVNGSTTMSSLNASTITTSQLTQTGSAKNSIINLETTQVDVTDSSTFKTIDVTSDMTIGGKMTIAGAINQTSSSANVLGPTTVQGSLTATGLTQTGNLTVSGPMSVTGSFTANSLDIGSLKATTGTFTTVETETMNVTGTIEGNLVINNDLECTYGDFGTVTAGQAEISSQLNLLSGASIQQTSGSNSFASSSFNGNVTVNGNVQLTSGSLVFSDGTIQTTAATMSGNPVYVWEKMSNTTFGTANTTIINNNTAFEGPGYYKIECNLQYNNTTGDTRNFTTTLGWSSGNQNATISIPNSQFKIVSFSLYVYAAAGSQAGAMALYSASSSGTGIVNWARLIITKMGTVTITKI